MSSFLQTSFPTHLRVRFRSGRLSYSQSGLAEDREGFILPLVKTGVASGKHRAAPFWLSSGSGPSLKASTCSWKTAKCHHRFSVARDFFSLDTCTSSMYSMLPDGDDFLQGCPNSSCNTSADCRICSVICKHPNMSVVTLLPTHTIDRDAPSTTIHPIH